MVLCLVLLANHFVRLKAYVQTVLFAAQFVKVSADLLWCALFLAAFADVFITKNVCELRHRYFKSYMHSGGLLIYRSLKMYHNQYMYTFACLQRVCGKTLQYAHFCSPSKGVWKKTL